MVATMAPSGTIARPARLFKLSGLWAPVVDTARLYNCARCRCQVVICHHCDQGNVYCRPCAPVAGREAHRRADAKYQQTERGKQNHKVRQQRYLEKMTDKGSPGSLPASPSRANAEAVPSASAKEDRDACSSPSPATTTPPQAAGAPRRSDGQSGHSCDFCGRLCSAYLRLETLAHCTLEEQGDHSVPLPSPRLERPRHSAASWSAPPRRAGPDRTRSPPALL